MSIHPAWQQTFDFFQLPVVLEPSRATLSSDAGLLPLRQFDQHVGLTRACADPLDDPRDPDLRQHSFREMVRSRVYGILADDEDQNDHDTLRSDPVFKLIADRSPDDPDLASQPTLSRFENAISIQSLRRLRDVFIDQFIASLDRPPRRLILDLDAIDDPAQGHQLLTFWHGYYDQNQYLPLAIPCAGARGSAGQGTAVEVAFVVHQGGGGGGGEQPPCGDPSVVVLAASRAIPPGL